MRTLPPRSGFAARLATAVLCAAAALPGTGCEPAPDPGVVRLEFWTLALRPRFDAYMNGQLEAFERAHPGVDVVWVDVPYEALERKLIAAAAAGRGPDVVNMADLNFARFAALGAFGDLTPNLPGNADDRYLAGALGLCRINGRLLALPWYVNPQARLVNAQVLATGGLTPETLARNWLGLAAQAREFKARTGGFLFSQPLGEESQLPIMLLSEGLPPLRPGPDGGLVSDILRPDIAAYLRVWTELYRDGVLPREAATKGYAHLTEMFQDGRLGVINTGPNFVERVQRVSPRVFDQTVVLPGAVGALGRVHLPVMVLAALAASDQPALAAELAWFMTGPGPQEAFCREVSILPSTRASLDDPYFSDGPPPGATDAERRLASGRLVAAATLPDAVAFTAALETWPDLRRSFEDEFKRVLTDGVELGTALARIDREWNRLLAAAAPAEMDAVPRPAPVPAAEERLAPAAPGGAGATP